MTPTILLFYLISTAYNAPIPSQSIVNIHRGPSAPITVAADTGFSFSWNFNIEPKKVFLVGIQASKENKTYEIANKIMTEHEFTVFDESLKKYGIQLNNTIFSIGSMPKHLDGYTLQLLITYNPPNQASPQIESFPIGEIKIMRTMGTTERKRGALLIVPLTILGVMALLSVIIIMIWQIKSYKTAQKSLMHLTDLNDDEDKKKKSSYVILAQKILGPDEIDENGLPKKSNWI